MVDVGAETPNYDSGLRKTAAHAGQITAFGPQGRPYAFLGSLDLILKKIVRDAKVLE